MARARIDIIGDAASFLRSLRQSSSATNHFRGDLSKLAVTARTTAAAQVRAAVQADARIRSQITAYREAAAAARRGSKEQISAANLAAQAERRLGRSIAYTAAESRKVHGRGFAAGVAKGAEETHGRLRKMAGSVASLGFSLLAGGGIVFGLKELVNEAISSKEAMAQLQQAVRSVGETVADTRGPIDKQLEQQRQLGFSESDSIKSMTTLERATHSVTLTRKAQLLVDNIARGRHVSLATAANAVTKAYGGSIGALRRLVPTIAKGSTATEALREATRSYAGSAVRYSRTAAGAQDRLTQSIKATESTAGNVLLPTITRLSSRLSDWLSKSRNQARVQQAVRQGLHALGIAARIVVALFRTGAPIVRNISRALGGTGNTIKALVGAFLLVKGVGMIGHFLRLGGAAEGSTGKIASLSAGLGKAGLVAQVGLAAFAIATLVLKLTGLDKKLEEVGGKLYGLAEKIGLVAKADLNAFDDIGSGNKLAVEIRRQVLVRRSKGQSDDTIKQAIEAEYSNMKKSDIDPLIVAGLRVADRGGTVNAKTKAAAGKGKPGKPGATPPPKRHGLSREQRNALALADAKTPAAELAALVEERQIIADKIRAIRRKLKTATGVEADLLISDLTSLEQEDTDAFEKIHSIQQAGAAKKRAAAAKAAAAARKAARDYATQIATQALKLKTAAASTTAAAATRKAYSALIAFDRREAQDTRLSEGQRARYAADATREKKKMVAQIIRDRKNAAKAIENRQLKALGIGKGSSVSALLEQIQQAGEAKQQGQPTGTAGVPTVKALRKEAAEVTKALKGTYLDTNVSRNVLSRIQTLLSGKLGQLNATMRGRIRQLLVGMKGDLNRGFDGFNLTAAERRRRSLDKRYADTYGTNRHRRGAASTPPQNHWHFEPTVNAVLNEPVGRALDRSFFHMRASLGKA